MKILIFSDLDGTLLNQEDYDYKPALPVLEKLKQLAIPVIPVTSKTCAEVSLLRQELGLSDPFIVENGSGVFVPLSDPRWVIANPQPQGGYHVELFGCNYAQIRTALKAISSELGENLRGFGDLTAAEIQELTGLPLEKINRAKTREFSEPFLTPPNIPPDTINKVVAAQGLRVVIGDRFSHLIGAGAGKGRALSWLRNIYATEDKIVTIGLGNSPNDIEMLATVDFPIVVPGSKGPHPRLSGRGWAIAPAAGARGWARAVNAMIEKR